MTEDIEKLITILRLGEYEDPAEKIGLLAAALVEQRADLELLLSLMRAPQVPLRLAGIKASRDRAEPELLSELLLLAKNAEVRVRFAIVEVLGPRNEKGISESLRELVNDADAVIRAAVIRATARREDFREIHEKCFLKDSDWSVRFAALNALESQESPAVVKTLALAFEQEDDSDTAKRCAEIIERHLQESPTATQKHLPQEIGRISRIETRLKEFGSARYPQFMSWVATHTHVKVDPEVLAKFGTDLTAMATRGALPRAHHFDEACSAVMKLLQQSPPRSMALIGPAGVGKSALMNEVVHRLIKPENGGWHVLRMSPTDFMVGTKYLGEWETKLRNLIDAIRKPRKVVLYIPNLSDLSAVGTWERSDSSVATALAPYVEDGSVVVIGESTPEVFERGLGKIPSLRRLLERVLVAEPSAERTHDILRSVRDEEGSVISDDVLGQLLEVSSQFLSHISRPGSAVELLRAVIKMEQDAGRPVVFRDVLDCLSRSIGIPSDLLDDRIPLKHSDVLQFFERKIIGQRQAVEAVADLVTLIKAGVTDPNRPFGVLLFVGPTGVGKTELARALAEFIFGDPARMKRFDMSEFANYDALVRLIGTAYENGLLTDAVRQHPFSVVLLDEIEKAHPNVFDLCLQIFDAGRLTDGRGRTVDFRRTIIILTSNIGATVGLMGFGSKDGNEPARDKKPMPRELARFFRPEFLNRLDRIVQFGPISLDVAEQIARREIEAVLQRSGIRRRELVVDVEPGVVSLLVREGYSAQFGARPLKRTVERLLLLPIAKAIAVGALQGRTILRLTKDGSHVRADVVAPPSSKSEAQSTSRQSESGKQVVDLQGRYAALEGSVQELMNRKSELIAQTRDPKFFQDSEIRAAVLNEIHNLDHFVELYQETGRAIRTLVEHRHQARAGNGQWRRDAEGIAKEIGYLSFVAACKDAQDLGDAVVIVSLIDRTGENQDAIQKLVSMYQGLSQRRRLTAEVWGELYSESQDRVYLSVSGLGAYGLLKRECGLHQVDRRYKERIARSGRERMREDRELFRVETVACPAEVSKRFQQDLKVKVVSLKPTKERLIRADLAVTVFHQSSLRSLEFWTSGPKDDAETRGAIVLKAILDRGDEGKNAMEMVRQYDLGLSPRIKDVRTGQITSRVAQVLKGDVETLII
jgi:ATP-dependent Clp protease ATP-binding subunit ClpA